MDELLILSRAVHFGACLVLLALFVVRLLIERPAAVDGWTGRRLACICLAAAAGSGFLWLWMASAGMSGAGLMESLDPRLFQTVLEQTPPGHVWIVRGVIGALLAVVLCFRRLNFPLGLPLAAMLLGSLAWLGHAGAGEDGRQSLMLAADVTHLLAAGVWPAGLLPLGLLLRRQMKRGELAPAHAAVRRFSAMSLVFVSMLAASGVVNATLLVGSFRALIETDYGRILIIKVSLFLTALALGACNLLLHKPRLESEPAALGSIARKVWIEAGLGALIVLLVAVMGILPPASHP